MNSKEIVVSKKTAFTIALVIAILAALMMFGGKLSILGFGQSDNATNMNLVDGSPEKFDMLSSHSTQGNVGST